MSSIGQFVLFRGTKLFGDDRSKPLYVTKDIVVVYQTYTGDGYHYYEFKFDVEFVIGRRIIMVHVDSLSDMIRQFKYELASIYLEMDYYFTSHASYLDIQTKKYLHSIISSKPPRNRNYQKARYEKDRHTNRD